MKSLLYYSIIYLLLINLSGELLAYELSFEQISESNFAYITDGNNSDEDYTIDFSSAFAMVSNGSYGADISIGQFCSSGLSLAEIRMTASFEGNGSIPSTWPYNHNSSSEAEYKLRVSDPLINGKVQISFAGGGYNNGYEKNFILKDTNNCEIFSYAWNDGSLEPNLSVIIDLDTDYYLTFTAAQENINAYDASASYFIETWDAPPQAVPEPATMFLLCTGLFGVVEFRKKVKKINS